MVKIAKKIGADCVKFQFFNAEKLISKMHLKHLIKK